MTRKVAQAKGCRMIVIGLTGVPSVGKGVVTDCLVAWCAARELRLTHLSFSDEIRSEARARGLTAESLDREQLRTIVTEMRAEEGPGVLAARLIRRIQEAAPTERADVCIVEAVRHPDEIGELRSAFGEAFRMVAITADLERVAEWVLARRRPDEARGVLASRKAAIALLEKELRGSGDLAVDVGACIEAADCVIENDGTLDDLARKAEDVARRFIVT